MEKLNEVKQALKYLEIDAKAYADNFSASMIVSTKNILAIAEAFRALAQRAEAAEAKLAELEKQEPIACKKRLVNHRSGVAHHWTYHGEVDRPSSGDIFRVEVVPLYEHPAPAADLAALVPDEVIVLLVHLEDILPDAAFNLIDVKLWNAVSALSRPDVYRAAILRNIEEAK